MDKYVLVPSDQYRKNAAHLSSSALTAAGSGTSIAAQGASSTPAIPPPGLPQKDSLATKGVKVSRSEASDISRQIHQLNLEHRRPEASPRQSATAPEDVSESGSEGEGDNWTDWRDSWTSI